MIAMTTLRIRKSSDIHNSVIFSIFFGNAFMSMIGYFMRFYKKLVVRLIVLKFMKIISISDKQSVRNWHSSILGLWSNVSSIMPTVETTLLLIRGTEAPKWDTWGTRLRHLGLIFEAFETLTMYWRHLSHSLAELKKFGTPSIGANKFGSFSKRCGSNATRVEFFDQCSWFNTLYWY